MLGYGLLLNSTANTASVIICFNRTTLAFRILVLTHNIVNAVTLTHLNNVIFQNYALIRGMIRASRIFLRHWCLQRHYHQKTISRIC